MNFKVIDRNTWDRKEYFDYYLTTFPCTYSLTAKLDITEIKKAGFKLYPTILYYITKMVNQYEQFRTAFREDGQLVIFDEMNPCYTIFHKDTQTFSNIWTEFSDDYDIFCERYEQDLRQFGNVNSMTGKPNKPENLFTVSMIPWTSFDGFNLNVKNFEYLNPMFTLGKFYHKEGRYLLPVAVQVHHAVCDGFHISSFLSGLQELIDN